MTMITIKPIPRPCRGCGVSEAEQHIDDCPEVRAAVERAGVHLTDERAIRDLRAEVDAAREAADRRLDKSIEWMERAESAEAALTRVRELADTLAEVEAGVSPEAKAWAHWSADRIYAALDPATDATRPSPASTGATGRRAGSAPSEGHSEARGDDAPTHNHYAYRRALCGEVLRTLKPTPGLPMCEKCEAAMSEIEAADVRDGSE